VLDLGERLDADPGAPLAPICVKVIVSSGRIQIAM
jgi:hypothetical protein